MSKKNGEVVEGWRKVISGTTRCEDGLIIQYGVYLNGRLATPYDTPDNAYGRAVMEYEETGEFHEVREIRQATR